MERQRQERREKADERKKAEDATAAAAAAAVDGEDGEDLNDSLDVITPGQTRKESVDTDDESIPSSLGDMSMPDGDEGMIAGAGHVANTPLVTTASPLKRAAQTEVRNLSKAQRKDSKT